MEAFEAWRQSLKLPEPKLMVNQAYQEGLEDSWRAALEWVYDKLDYSGEHEELKRVIEQELGENQ